MPYMISKTSYFTPEQRSWHVDTTHLGDRILSVYPTRRAAEDAIADILDYDRYYLQYGEHSAPDYAVRWASDWQVECRRKLYYCLEPDAVADALRRRAADLERMAALQAAEDAYYAALYATE